MKDITGIIPEQFTGKEITAEASIKIENEEAAQAFFKIVKDRLLNVSKWDKVAKGITATFHLIDSSGNEVNRKAEKGDYFKIDIPGPHREDGSGYDWVTVEDIKEAEADGMESLGFRVRPVRDPFNDKDETAHFYSEESTSNFIVTLKDNKISANIIDRNIKPNKEATGLFDKIRDFAVGTTAMGLFSKVQWQALADGLIKKED